MELRLSGGSRHTEAEPRDRGRAFGPGPRRAPAAALAALALAAALALTLSGSPSKANPAALRYGSIPSWIPKPKVAVQRLVHASPAHPWLAIEGDSVAVGLPSGHALVTAVGPRVPPGVVARVPLATAAMCTFTVTFAHLRGSLPLDPRAFTVLDELGQVVRMHVSALGGGPLPKAATGRSRPVSIAVRAMLPVGAGTLRWAPLGRHAVVSWEFDVEVD
jgi:hypothetical protein